MTTVLRELVAKLGFEVDKRQWDAANAGVEQIKRGLNTLESNMRGTRSGFFAVGASSKVAATGFAGAAASAARLQSGLLQLGLGVGLGALLTKMTKLASDANETDNVLSEVFGSSGSEEIKQWAQQTSQWLGRSEFTLRKNAGALGAMLEPMTGSSEKAKEMSKNIGALAIDLASFFNTADDDALAALKSGLSGETEPLRRYGVVLLDATLQEFAHAQGINKKVQAMTVAEKTELRYQFIMANTTKAQGDAHRTMDGFANASRALGDNLKDLGTRIGQRLLGPAGQLIVWGNKAISMFLELSRKSTIVEASLLTLVGAFALLKAEAMLALAGPLIAFALIALAIDDINTLFTGGQSAIGRWLDEIGGVGTAQEFVDDMKASLEAIKLITKDVVELWQELPDLQGSWELIAGAVDDVGFAIERLMDKFAKFLNPAQLVTEGFTDGVRSIAGALGIDLPQADLTANDRTAGRGVDAEALDTGGQIRLRQQQRIARIQADVAARRALREGAAAARAAGDELGIGGPRATGQVVVSAPAAPAAAGATSNVTVNNGPINLVVGAGSNATDVVRAARRAAEAERRRTLEAVKRGV